MIVPIQWPELARLADAAYRRRRHRHGSIEWTAERVDDRIVISVTGTNELRDWWTNFRVWPTWSRWGRLHTGWLRAAEAIADDVHSMARTCEDVRFIADGHSLGGSSSTYMTLLLTAGGWQCDQYAGFGTPSCLDEDGNEAWDALFMDRVPHRRFRLPGDVVAGWPVDQLLRLVGFCETQETRIAPSGVIGSHSMAAYVAAVTAWDLSRRD